MTWHPVFGAKTAFLELPRIPRLLAIPSNISALVSISARTLRALIGLNGTDWPHLEPPLTPSAHGPGAPGSSALDSQTLPGLCCRCASLQPCLWPHLLGGPWTHVVARSPAALTGWALGLVHPLAVSGTVDGHHYQHPALLRPFGTVPGSVRTQPQFPSLLSFPFFVKFKALILFFLTIHPYSWSFLCSTFLLPSPQDILLAALFSLRLEFIFL